ncbi:hypothetical protein KZZ52_13015 [Dactylosporangium sp. AC04546]|uniref:hypothetical protein n=1 Tax=Dactylosporangium sp. AC04546 TaxID=2862460 RepID=UPI001EDE181C|nr:hypothetical protein [Dactylosporangium sp. AC04546]WVK86257.1 hypothetical protein KZZ52_13015 [Dactylosporangium sp. AC04546]
MQPELFDVADAPELRSPVADASMRARWRALILTDPVARLVRNAAHADVHEAYDLRQLALAAIDIAVASLGFARPVTLAELVDEIAGLAALMRPDPAAALDAARWVIKGLLNDADNQSAFVYPFVDTARGASEEFAFKLLQLQDGPDGAVVLASPQAVMVYLNGLDLDVDDAEAAFSVVLQRQLRDRRFEAAGRTATQAERVSVAMSASLADVLDATRRDVRAFDWVTDVPSRLERAREHVEARIAADAEVLNHVAAGIDTETDAAVRRASGDLVDTLRRIRQVHLDLAERVAGARGVFLQAQLSQVFARRIQLRLLNIEAELFQPVLQLTQPRAQPVAEAFGDRILGLRVPRLLHLDGLTDMLLAPPRVTGPAEAEPELPGETEGVDLQSYPPAVVAAATRILRRAEDRPVPLSALLAEAGDADERELVLLSALWAYAPDSTGDEEDDGLTALTAGVAAERTGALLDHPGVWGDDLMVTYRRDERLVEGAEEPVA